MDRHDFPRKAVEILRKRPGEFFTAYQLAIEIEQTFQRGIDYPDWPVGGEGLGEHSSLAQYLARFLPPRVRNGQVTEIQVAYLSHLHMTNLTFSNGGDAIRASTLSSEERQTLFGYVGQV